MNTSNLNKGLKYSFGLLTGISGIFLIGLSATAMPIEKADPNSQLSSVVSQQAQKGDQISQINRTPGRTNVIQPPLPESRSNAVARVIPTQGTVSIQVINRTNVPVTYEAIAYTQQRTLRGGANTTLLNLPAPVTVTFNRQDDGLLNVIPRTTSKNGVLQVILEEQSRLSDQQGTLRVQDNGQVFLN